MKALILTTVLVVGGVFATYAQSISAQRDKATNLEILKLAERISLVVGSDALRESGLSPDQRAEAVAFALLVVTHGALSGSPQKMNPNVMLDEAARLAAAARTVKLSAP